MVNHRCIYTHTPTRMHARMHTCTYAKPSPHAHPHAHTHMRILTYASARTRVCTRKRTHALTSRRTHTRAQLCTHMQTHTHTRTCAPSHTRTLVRTRMQVFLIRSHAYAHTYAYRKWSKLCADFYGPLPSSEYLLVVLDEYSRFPEVEIVKSLSAQTVIPIFDKVFSSRGIPENLKTDNGSPFQSSEFRNFANDLGFQHQRITLHSLANMWSLRGL